MDRKDWLIKQCQRNIARHDEKMDYSSKVLREQAVAFVNRYLSPEQLALAVTYSIKQSEEKKRHGG